MALKDQQERIRERIMETRKLITVSFREAIQKLAIGKNIEWKSRTKTDVGTWKDLRRRMQESGMMNDHDVDGSNIERFRPVGGAQELNMDNTQIPGVSYHLPPEGAAPAVIFSAADQAKLKKLDPELSAALALLPNDARQTILDEMNAPQKKPRRKRSWSPEQRAEFGERMKAAREAKKAA